MIIAVIGTGFGLEWRMLDDNRQPHLLNHTVEHVIMQITQPVLADLHMDMSISKMIGGARQFLCVAVHCGN